MSCIDWLTWPTMIEEGLSDSCCCELPIRLFCDSCELPIMLFCEAERREDEEVEEDDEVAVPMMASCEGWLEGLATLSSMRENWPPLEIGISIMMATRRC